MFGPVRNGGIGTQFRNLAFALVEGGHEVTILFTQGERSEDGEFADWVAWYRDRGIRLVALPPTRIALAGGSLTASGQRSFETYDYLRRHDGDFDVVHAADFVGVLYFALQAKACGFGFHGTTFVTGVHSGAWWNHEGNVELPSEFPQLLRIAREIGQTELSDVVVSSSQHMLRWLSNRGVRLPEKTFVWPNAVGSDIGRASTKGQAPEPALGVAFTGRLEPRKGIHLFFAALRLLPRDLLSSMPIYLMGKETPKFDLVGAIDSLLEDCPDAREPVVLSDLNADEALQFLVDERLLAVAPSTLDNSPMMISACLDWGIPFVTTNAGGAHEMLESKSGDHAVVAARPDSIAERIEAALRVGIPRLSRSRDAESIDRGWSDWHSSLGAAGAPPSFSRPDVGDVTVCVTHHNRAVELSAALESIAAQTTRPAEVIVVDNGSTEADALAVLDSLDDRGTIGDVPVRVLRQANLYPGAARNRAVASCDTEFLLFMDDDNIAKPAMIETFLTAAFHQPDIGAFTCFYDRFWDGSDHTDRELLERVIPMGDVGAVGFVENAYGDTNSLVRRSAFEAIGGFHEVWGVGREDHSFFAQLSMSGERVMVVPRALFWYRRIESTISRRHFDKMAGPSIAAMHGASSLDRFDRLMAEYGAAIHLRGRTTPSLGRGQDAIRLERTIELVRDEMELIESELGLLRSFIDDTD
ncbi:MAG: glycosyltransferase [Acidimicrobiales bacterium]